MTDWNPVTSPADAQRLLELFGDFHDSCLREVHVWTEAYVSEDLAMACPLHLDTRVRMLVHRQAASPSAIEMLFEQVLGFRLSPTPEDYAPIIFDATLEWRRDTVFWSDDSGQREASEDATWVLAKRLSWRDASEWMGNQLRYGPTEGGSARHPGIRRI
jgi:hypothetical protein